MPRDRDGALRHTLVASVSYTDPMYEQIQKFSLYRSVFDDLPNIEYATLFKVSLKDGKQSFLANVRVTDRGWTFEDARKYLLKKFTKSEHYGT